MSGVARGRSFHLDGPPLIALAGVAAILAVALWPTGPLHDGATVIASKELRFVERPGGAMDVVDTATGKLAGRVPTVKDGFVPGLLHGVAVTRQRYGINPGLPYRITEMSDGRVLLLDPAEHLEIDLESFGHGNAQSFTAFLHGTEEQAP